MNLQHIAEINEQRRIQDFKDELRSRYDYCECMTALRLNKDLYMGLSLKQAKNAWKDVYGE